ncbi:leukocyte receptor cluster member 8 homolog isoform X2 [Phymastichus coffea]|nr:leukocyte receptor cluster member 8 homolog isoform X2 [Phymastichus coffea]XP_058808396.1 leukocyte receptor cluster member 8 homolog isoform X2 [Phymastichus coffea]XP_058808398.1 leukocyte receptor cluster member 8 homolog isoform X2 [Phymastichus coffea]
MANMAWQQQYSQNNMHLYSHYQQMYNQGYNHQNQAMYYQHYNMMGYGQYGQMSGQGQQHSMQQQQQQMQQNQQQNQQQKQQQQSQQQSQQQGNQGKKPTEQTPPIPPTPMTFDDDSDLPPLPPGPPPPSSQVQSPMQKTQQISQNQTQHNNQQHNVQQHNAQQHSNQQNNAQQHNNQQASHIQQYAYNSYPYGGWNPVQQTESNNFSGIRFNLPNQKAGLGYNQQQGQQGQSSNSGAAKKKRKRNKNLAAQYNQFQATQQQQPQLPNTSIPPPNMLNASSELPPLPPLPAEKPPSPPPIEEITIPPSPQATIQANVQQPPPPLPKVPPIDTSQPPPPLPPPAIVKPSPAKLAAPAPSPISDWPDSLKNYVNRCYEKCKTAVDKDQVEIILKGKITRSANDGSLWLKDWDNEPLPSIHSERMTMTIKPLQVTVGPAGLRKPGISMNLGARLGTKSSPFLSSSSSKLNNTNKSRSRSRSKSPSQPRKYRRSTSSSSSSEHDYKVPVTQQHNKQQKNKKGQQQQQQQQQHHHHQQNLNQKQNKKNKNNKQKMNVNKANCHFYSEHGIQGGNIEEFGTKEKLQQRAARFSNSFTNKQHAPPPPSAPQRPAQHVKPSMRINNMIVRDDPTAEFDFTGLHIVGTCTDLEKPYLRLTSAPAASAVRPVSVLKHSLDHVKKRWATKQDYRYTCDQLKSIRQDLTVQGIRDSFTVHVYETHARVALERGDHEEFNQCQTQLRMLYSEVGGENRCEFVAYRILYYIFTKNTSDLTTILAALSDNDKKDECVDHALKVRSAWWLGNYHSFFKLYKQAPRMAGFLMDWFIARERKLALKQMIKVYRQNLAVDFIIAQLAFESTEKFYEFVAEFSLAYGDAERKQLDCKTSSSSIGAW